MFENQVAALTAILKDEDIRKYAGDAFSNIINAVVTGDITALAGGADDVKNIIFHTPTVIFWDKMKRYLYGTFLDYNEQLKMAEKFTKKNKEYEDFVKRQIHLINEINDDRKVDYFANLTRSYILTDMDDILYYKLANYINICIPEELDYIKKFNYDGKTNNSVIVSSLYQYGLFDQNEKDDGGVYILSDFAKALKDNSLNYCETEGTENRIVSYGQMSPLNIAEPLKFEDLEDLIGDTEVIINGGTSML